MGGPPPYTYGTYPPYAVYPPMAYPQPYPQPYVYAYPPMQYQEPQGIGVASLVCGIIGMCIFWIPIVNFVSIILGIIALALGGVAMSKHQRNGVAGVVLGVLSIVLSIVMWLLYSSLVYM